MVKIVTGLDAQPKEVWQTLAAYLGTSLNLSIKIRPADGVPQEGERMISTGSTQVGTINGNTIVVHGDGRGQWDTIYAAAEHYEKATGEKVTMEYLPGDRVKPVPAVVEVDEPQVKSKRTKVTEEEPEIPTL